MRTLDAIRKLAALAHEGRLELFRRLVEAGPEGEAAGDLARFANIGPTTASAQLLVLSNAGLVTSKRDGRSVIYAVDFEAMSHLLQFMMNDCCKRRSEICGALLPHHGTLLETKSDA